MPKIEYINVKRDLRSNTEEEKQELKDKANKINEQATEKITKKKSINKPDKTPEITKMSDDDKIKLVLDYFNKNYVKDAKGELSAITIFNKMKEDTNIKLLSFKFMDILRNNNITLVKKDKYYIMGYSPKN